ncbi:MAG TPA: hypothetical protein VFH48_10995, partial [Chloroflexota bacterium]|nr:hypothetical protein [Chloroflexota bacterium]
MISLVGKQWVEIKTLALGRVVQAADGTVRTTDLSYCSRRAAHTAFRRLALVETYRRGVGTALTVVAVVDGADGARRPAAGPAHRRLCRSLGRGLAPAQCSPPLRRPRTQPPDRLPLPPPRRALRLQRSPHRRRPSRRRSSTVARPPPIPGSGASSLIVPLRLQQTAGHP